MDKKKFKKKKKRIKIYNPRKCPLCRDKVKHIDYKDLDLLERFFTPHGKIMSRTRMGVCATHMRKAKSAIKVAQHMALLPFSVY